MSAATYPQGAVDSHTQNAQTYRAKAEKESRRAHEDCRDTYQAMELARGQAIGAIARKAGITIDGDLAQSLDQHRVALADYFQQMEEDATTTAKENKALHNELNHIHAQIAAITAKLGMQGP